MQIEIPGYTLVKKTPLGEGGFAKVYLAKHSALQLNVALKVMDSKLADDDDFCKRFLLEARTCANLGNHPNIINIFDVGRIEDSYYIAMQYLSGPNLRDILDSGEPYNHPLELIRPIVDALGYAHENGVVHRDVKPANILFDEAGRAMLADFGIAKSLNEHTQLTMAGAAIGTAAYMSPEQAKGLPNIDGRSDLYAIGVLLFEILTGGRPYQSTDQMGLMLQHVNDPIPQLPESEIAYQPLISRLMAKEPDDRYQDHKAVLADIDALLNGDFDSLQPKKKSQFTSKKAMLSAGAMAAIVLAAGATWVTINDGGNEPQNVPATFVATETQDAPAVLVEIDAEEAPKEALKEELIAERVDTPEVQRLLELATLNEEFGQLTEPPGSNALELYEAILRKVPDHPIALQRRDEIKQQTDK